MSLFNLKHKLRNTDPAGRGYSAPGTIPSNGMREIVSMRKAGYSWDQINDKLPVQYQYNSGNALGWAAVKWWREHDPATAPKAAKRKRKERMSPGMRDAIQRATPRKRKKSASRKKAKRAMTPARLAAIRKNAAKARKALARKVAARRANVNGEAQHPIAAKSR